MDLMTILGIAGAIMGGASAITAVTPTPDPKTTWGKIYKGIEIAGLVIGKAKQTGALPGNAVADKLAADAAELAKQLLAPAPAQR